MNWKSKFVPVQVVDFPKAISKFFGLRSWVGIRLAVAYLEARDLTAEPRVFLQMTKEHLKLEDSLLSQHVLKVSAWFRLHVDVAFIISTQ